MAVEIVLLNLKENRDEVVACVMLHVTSYDTCF